MKTLKLDDKVYDRWWPGWGTGTVIKRLKHSALIQYPNKILRYDRAHFQFLELKSA